MNPHPRQNGFVSRGGRKLAAALDQFRVDPTGWVCADLGANVGGFTDCLLQRGAAKVYAVDTAYGVLDYTLRKDPRVVVLERVNALHLRLPELCDLVVIDLGWTPQRLILPRAREVIKPAGRILTLVKPHYEAPRDRLRNGVLPADDAEKVFQKVIEEMRQGGLVVRHAMESPVRGAKGNVEYLVLVERQETDKSPVA